MYKVSLKVLTYCLTASLLIFCAGCTQDQSDNQLSQTTTAALDGPLFQMVDPAHSNLQFSNQIQETDAQNYIFYNYFYNGGGVSLGDINNDGLIDIYLSANQQSNKLYLNKGNLQFEDITAKAGVADATGWTTGVNMIDINGDGWLDIYVCKAGYQNFELRQNKLYINDGKMGFTEQAKTYGLNDDGFATQSYFLDYDKDGDLDMYLVNHRHDFKNNTKLSQRIDNDLVPELSDKLFRNDGNNRFTEVGKAAGIMNKAWGLSATIADFNDDGWEDIYVANDFMQPDYLYINNQKGGFTNQVQDYMRHISFYSMGSDISDINNDGLPDLVVLDMVAEDHVRSKRNMASMSNFNFWSMVERGYHYQYMQNSLQLNNGKGSFSEISQLAGISKTDWSWAPLLADFDNDGYKDLFVTNGIKRDVTDNDFKLQLAALQKAGKKINYQQLLNMMPSNTQANYIFQNNGDLSFSKKTMAWGLSRSVNSNGSAYADLDNDGDLDLVVNNLDAVAAIYKNTSNTANNYLDVQLKGNTKNPMGIGAKITLQSEAGLQYQEQYLSRGFQSSVSPVLHFGLGKTPQIDRLTVAWPDGTESILQNVKVNQRLVVEQKQAKKFARTQQKPKRTFQELDPKTLGIDYRHQEKNYDDFLKEILLPHKHSQHGPYLAKADVNGDGLEDFFVGGAAGSAGALYVQDQAGKFQQLSENTWKKDKAYEDLGLVFFDADQDEDLDLYVVSGSNEFPEQSPLLQDRLYLNDGKGNFKKANNRLPKMLTSGLRVRAADFDGDGDQDLFVGGRVVPAKYPQTPRSYLLQNDKGYFKDVTKSIAPELASCGMVTDAIFTDVDQDKDLDLLVVGEWMPIQLYKNEQNKLVLQEEPSLAKTNGWWFSIRAGDFDGDGDQDYMVGNLGKNKKFKANYDSPFHVYCNDFDDSGSLDIVLSSESTGTQLPVRGRECSSQQMPFIKEKFPTYKQFAEASLDDIYGEKLASATHLEAYTFASSYLQNNGDGSFELIKLPNPAQIGPITGMWIDDYNQDKALDVIAIGNIYGSEVETVRYDASVGVLLEGNSQAAFKAITNLQSGIRTNGDAKDILLIERGTHPALLLVSLNNQAVQTFRQN
ncbi:MAG: VCBS repeat-containing protein [Saprospiraceae bacterium]